MMFAADNDAVSDLETRMEELVRTQEDLKEQLGSACNRADKGESGLDNTYPICALQTVHAG